jgi:hypothetical protein
MIFFWKRARLESKPKGIWSPPARYAGLWVAPILARIYRGMRPRLTSTFDELIVYC